MAKPWLVRARSTASKLTPVRACPTPKAATKRRSHTSMPCSVSSSRRLTAAVPDAAHPPRPRPGFHRLRVARASTGPLLPRLLRRLLLLAFVHPCGDHPLLALLRPSNIDNAVGVLKHLSRIIARLRECWPGVAILVRGDSGFCRDHLMRWCVRKTASISSSVWPRTSGCCGSWSRPGNRPGSSSPKRVKRTRVFHELAYRTHDSWSRQRRVVGKAEHLAAGPIRVSSSRR